MASGDEDSEDLDGATHRPRECMACRATGKVISNLGAGPSTIDCPWCEGSGMRPAEIDAQARWGEREPQAEAPPPAGEPSSA